MQRFLILATTSITSNHHSYITGFKISSYLLERFGHVCKKYCIHWMPLLKLLQNRGLMHDVPKDCEMVCVGPADGLIEPVLLKVLDSPPSLLSSLKKQRRRIIYILSFSRRDSRPHFGWHPSLHL